MAQSNIQFSRNTVNFYSLDFAGNVQVAAGTAKPLNHFAVKRNPFSFTFRFMFGF